MKSEENKKQATELLPKKAIFSRLFNNLEW